MQPRLRTELERFRPWLGHWRGPGKMADGRDAMIEMGFTPLFGGSCLQVDSGAFDLKAGSFINSGVGYWTVDAAGKLVAGVYSAGTGALFMREVPEDPPGVCLEGIIGGNTRFTVAVVPEGKTLTLTTRRTEGYPGSSRPITFATMHRIEVPTPERK